MPHTLHWSLSSISVLVLHTISPLRMNRKTAWAQPVLIVLSVMKSLVYSKHMGVVNIDDAVSVARALHLLHLHEDHFLCQLWNPWLSSHWATILSAYTEYILQHHVSPQTRLANSCCEAFNRQRHDAYLHDSFRARSNLVFDHSFDLCAAPCRIVLIHRHSRRYFCCLIEPQELPR